MSSWWALPVAPITFTAGAAGTKLLMLNVPALSVMTIVVGALLAACFLGKAVTGKFIPCKVWKHAKASESAAPRESARNGQRAKR